MHGPANHLAEFLVGQGTELHLGGYGGDAVLLTPLAYLSRTLRTRPLVAIAHSPVTEPSVDFPPPG
ncbi:MAG: hypothetical protein ACRDRY_15770 [Pseudonocardiaceae bacterium]